MRLVLHDYSGHPFPIELSRELAGRGHRVQHVHCTSYRTGKGALVRREHDPEGLELVPIDLGAPFDKYRYHRRIAQELRYGRLFCEQVDPDEVDVLVCGNVPLLALGVIARWARRHDLPLVFWQQDVYSLAMGQGARSALPVVGHAAARGFVALERHVARTSAQVVVISPDFLPILDAWGVPAERAHVIENWAPLGDLSPRPRDNTWAQDHGLGERPRLVYSGTIGLKHDPAPLLALARALPEADLVVVSEGPGADWVAEQAAAEGLDHVQVTGFQPIEDFPEVLGSADVLVALLEPDAGVFSVPSKVLSYHCAGRPILAAVPADNLAARTIDGAGSGVVVRPGDAAGLVAAAEKLLSDAAWRADLGRAARAHAESAFAIERIADRFEDVLAGATR